MQTYQGRTDGAERIAGDDLFFSGPPVDSLNTKIRKTIYKRLYLIFIYILSLYLDEKESNDEKQVDGMAEVKKLFKIGSR